MTDYISLALKYGGFTSLDKVYLQNGDKNNNENLNFWNIFTLYENCIKSFLNEILIRDNIF